MRPIVRGNWPTNTAGENIVFTEYQQARGELIKRMGELCSFCEMHLDTSLAVEHVQPKQPIGATAIIAARLLDWHNFLLACTNCNSTKSNKDVILDDYLWPDRDNTYHSFAYSEGGIVNASATLSPTLQQKANNMIKLVGLDKRPSVIKEASDRRWLNRKESWDIATRSKERLTRSNTEDMKAQIIETAQAKGFWSVWMTVFKDDTDMLSRFINTFSGTCADCFDSAKGFAPIPRQGGLC
jgi:uncharacterized protein (TIGR02646 family)